MVKTWIGETWPRLKTTRRSLVVSSQLAVSWEDGFAKILIKSRIPAAPWDSRARDGHTRSTLFVYRPAPRMVRDWAMVWWTVNGEWPLWLTPVYPEAKNTPPSHHHAWIYQKVEESMSVQSDGEWWGSDLGGRLFVFQIITLATVKIVATLNVDVGVNNIV